MPKTEVVCRCRKTLTSYKAWIEHLRSRHPRLYVRFKADGTLEEDREVFRRQREIA